MGLTSYVKACSYVSAVSDDRSLQFQVGPDEGMTEAVGIAKMEGTSLFRATAATTSGAYPGRRGL